MSRDFDALNETRPRCFACLDEVFPIGDDGLRHSPERCMVCYCKVECLRTAMAGDEGVKVKEELVDRAYESGVSGFLERWAKRKTLAKQATKKKKS